MASEGIKLFYDDYLNFAKGGTITASSNTTGRTNAFDNRRSTRWKSSDQATNGDTAYLRNEFTSAKEIDAIYAYNCNIEDVTFEFYNGTGWEDIVSGSPTSGGSFKQSSDGKHTYFEFDDTQSLQGIGIKGDNTIVADQEKYVTLLLAFKSIGQFTYYPVFDPTYDPNQIDFKLEDGYHFILEKGENFRCSLQFKSHVYQPDIDIAQILMDLKLPFYMWVNAGNEDQFDYKFKPFRFEDIFRLGLKGKYSPRLTKNYYKSGLNLKLNFIEVS